MAADLLGDGNIKCTFVTGDDAIASVSAPTAVELNGGVDLQERITRDGLGIEPEQEAVDNTSLASRKETEDAGTVKESIELTYKRAESSGDDTAYNTLAPGTLGFLAVRRNRPHEEAWEAGDEAEIYPVRCGERRRQPPELNTPQTVVQKMFNHTAGDSNATVA
jgi:hypothetical protein